MFSSYLVCFHFSFVLNHEDLSLFLSCNFVHQKRSRRMLSTDSPIRAKTSIPGKSVCLISPTCVLGIRGERPALALVVPLTCSTAASPRPAPTAAPLRHRPSSPRISSIP